MGRREKTIALFDDSSRKEFVTGFRKRSVQRKKVAEESKKELEKEARRQLRQERREALAAKRSKEERFTDAPELGLPSASQAQSEKLNDEFSRKAFGADAVVVTTVLGMPGDDEAEAAELSALRDVRSLGPSRPRDKVRVHSGVKARGKHFKQSSDKHTKQSGEDRKFQKSRRKGNDDGPRGKAKGKASV